MSRQPAQEENSYVKPPRSSDASARRSRHWFRSRRRPAGEAHGLKPRELVRRPARLCRAFLFVLRRGKSVLGTNVPRHKRNPTSDHPEERQSRVSKDTIYYELATALGPVELVKPD